ncbi:hypothetical protein BC332_01440 [Capsicum chinense]|nr:hypothetical protein BC332_01440 [Capsicum chinense]
MPELRSGVRRRRNNGGGGVPLVEQVKPKFSTKRVGGKKRYIKTRAAKAKAEAEAKVVVGIVVEVEEEDKAEVVEVNANKDERVVEKMGDESGGLSANNNKGNGQEDESTTLFPDQVCNDHEFTRLVGVGFNEMLTFIMIDANICLSIP